MAEETRIGFRYEDDEDEVGYAFSEIVPVIGSYVCLSTVRDERGNYPESVTPDLRVVVQGHVVSIEYEYAEMGHSSQSNTQKCYVRVTLSRLDKDE